MKIKIRHYTIGILEADINDFEFTICNGDVYITCGTGETFKKAKENALVALEEELELTKIAAKMARFEQYEKKPFRAFQWYPGHMHKDIGTLNSVQYFYKELMLNPGDWIFPSEDIVLTNNTFQKLFSKVIT